MFQHASFIPPDVVPPEPPGAKTITLIFSVFMSVVLIAFIGFVSIEFLADIAGIPLPHDERIERAIREQSGPFVSDFLGMSFPGQYASMLGKFPRPESYGLTAEDRKLAIQKLQDALQNSQEISVEIVDIQHRVSERYLLQYDSNLVIELCRQADLIEDTSISPLDFMRVPDLVFTLHPSEVNINFIANSSAHVPSMYVTLGGGMQRWEGNFGIGFIATLLDAQLQRGGTVRSRVSTRLPLFPLDAIPSRLETDEKADID